jgi:translation elongation factor P/translation initiation factor 5A
MKYVIINKSKRAFWSNKNGWGNLIDATRFEEVETEICFLPADSQWIKEEDAKCHKWLTEGEED